jgi:pimeloyl-ACP methyl ester carboxylesterase
MQAATKQEFVPLAIQPALDTRVALFAGGTSALLLVDVAGRDWARWSVVAHQAEAKGFSSLLFGLALPEEVREAAVAAAADLLRSLGIERIALIAAGIDASLAIRAAAAGRYEVLVLVGPDKAEDPATIAVWRAVRAPKLLLVGSAYAAGQETGKVLSRRAIGPIMVRHFPVGDRGAAMISGECGELVVESIIGFAARTCGIRSVEERFDVAGSGRFQAGGSDGTNGRQVL